MRQVLIILGLTLSCWVLTAPAEEVQWRPAGTAPTASQMPGPPTSWSPPPAPLSLTDAAVRPVGFTSTPSANSLPLLPAGNGPAAPETVQKPLPPGPATEGGPEPLPAPKQKPAPLPLPKSDSTTESSGLSTPLADEGLLCPGDVCCPGSGCGLESCPGPCCPECQLFCTPGPCTLPHFWASAEYLLWRIRDPNLPPLVTTTGGLTGPELLALRKANPSFQPGALGNVGTQVLLGGGGIDMQEFSGGRFTLGIAPWDCLGFEATYFFLGANTINRSFTSDPSGMPGLYRPFFNVQSGAQDAEIVAFPGLVAGHVDVAVRSSLWGAEGNFRVPLCCGCAYKLDFLTGFRFLDLSEGLRITEQPTFLVDQPNLGLKAGDSIRVTDQFGTINHFYGGQLGLDFECRRHRWIFGVTPKIALGSMHEVVNINGQTTFLPAAGGATTVNSGFLALPTNSGHFSRDRFAVIPEIALKVGYQLTDHLKLFVGYDFLFVSNVVRPGDQVDLGVNPSQLPTPAGPSPLVGPARPIVPFRETSFIAHGVNFGLEYTW